MDGHRYRLSACACVVYVGAVFPSRHVGIECFLVKREGVAKMIDFIIAAAAVGAVAWTVIRMLKRRKSSKDKFFCGFDCGACDRKCKY